MLSDVFNPSISSCEDISTVKIVLLTVSSNLQCVTQLVTSSHESIIPLTIFCHWQNYSTYIILTLTVLSHSHNEFAGSMISMPWSSDKGERHLYSKPLMAFYWFYKYFGICNYKMVLITQIIYFYLGGIILTQTHEALSFFDGWWHKLMNSQTL